MTNAAKEWVDVGTVFACDHPDARQLGLYTMYELTPAGECMPHSVTRH